MPATSFPRKRLVSAILSGLAAAILTAAPAPAQMHENGVQRQGQVLQSRPGGTAFMCRTACSLEAGCQGWSWTRPGANGPQASCALFSSVSASEADPCCESGDLRGHAATQVQGPALEGDRYASRTTRPDGPPVDLTTDPNSEIWGPLDDDEAEDGETAEDDQAAARPVVAAQAQPDAAARSSVRRGPPGGGRPSYSVQREYAPPPVAQAGQTRQR